MTRPRPQQSTLIFMTPIAVLCVALTALCIGYHFGRRAGATPVTWKKRTSRAALGKAALGLALLVSARRVQRNYRAWALKIVAPLRRDQRIRRFAELVGSIEFR